MASKNWRAIQDRQMRDYLSSPVKRELDEAYLRRNMIDRSVMEALGRGDIVRAAQNEERLKQADAQIENLLKELKRTESRRSR